MTNTKLNIEKEVLRILGGHGGSARRDMTKAETRIFNSLISAEDFFAGDKRSDHFIAIDIVRILRHRTGKPSLTNH